MPAYGGESLHRAKNQQVYFAGCGYVPGGDDLRPATVGQNDAGPAPVSGLRLCKHGESVYTAGF